MGNVKLALRMLGKAPFVSAVAILSLALGLGANAAIFTLFDQMLLSGLPVAAPDRLVNVSAPGAKPGSVSCNDAGDCDDVLSYPMFRDLEKAPGALSGLAAHRLFEANIAYQGTTLNGEGMLVSGGYFPLLGLQPLHGRLIGRGDDVTPGAHSIAVLSHQFWTTRLGSDQSVVGRTIIVNGTPLEIVGIAPKDFSGTTFGSRPAVFVPMVMRGVIQPGWEGFDDRRNYWAYVFGRLSPGTSMAEAETSLNTIYASIINDVEAPLQGMSANGLAQFRTKRLVLKEGHRGQSTMHKESRTPLLLMFATTGIVLLIACANIANLLLARGANRGMEMAVRLSLGASRRQVIAQLLTESVVLALAGGAVSLLAARWTLAGIGAILPPQASEALRLELNLTMVLFAGALSLATGVLFGLFPALHSTRPNLISTIRANAGNVTVTRGAARFRATLVTMQIALSMALLISAGLFLKSLINVTRVDLGVDTDDVVVFTISPALNGYNAARSRALFEQVEKELGAIPGVTSVASAMVPLIGGSNWGTSVSVEGFQPGPDVDVEARFNQVGPNWFGSFNVPILVGRDFTHADDLNTAEVVIVNEAFIDKFGLGSNAVGKRMATSVGDAVVLDMEIVGVVPNVAYADVKDEVPPLFFKPWRQNDDLGFLTFYVRSPLPAAQVLANVRDVMRRIDPTLPLEQLKTMPQQIRDRISLDRMISILSGAFAALATLLAALGLYGVLAYGVATRTREIGVRIAVGASARAVTNMVMGQMLRLFAIGGILGLIAAWYIGTAASSILFRMQGHDPAVFILAALLLGMFAVIAGYLPARRASRIEPLRALRHD